MTAPRRVGWADFGDCIERGHDCSRAKLADEFPFKQRDETFSCRAGFGMTEPSVTSRLPADLVARGIHRRDRLAVYGPVVAPRTALLVMNTQNAWLAPGAPFDPFDENSSAGVLPAINRLARAIRQGGGQVAWFRTTTGAPDTPAYWSTYFDNFAGEASTRSSSPGQPPTFAASRRSATR